MSVPSKEPRTAYLRFRWRERERLPCRAMRASIAGPPNIAILSLARAAIHDLDHQAAPYAFELPYNRRLPHYD